MCSPAFHPIGEEGSVLLPHRTSNEASELREVFAVSAGRRSCGRFLSRGRDGRGSRLPFLLCAAGGQH
jgi:hypothetical protein